MPKITCIDLLKVFVGMLGEVSLETPTDSINIRYSVIKRDPDTGEKTGKSEIRLINKNDYNDIENIFTGIFWSLNLHDRLLWILWTRENVFRIKKLQDDDKLGFIKRCFALNNDPVNTEAVEKEFETLRQEGFLKKEKENCRESCLVSNSGWTTVYYLKWEGKKVAKRIIKKKKDGTFVRTAPFPEDSETDLADYLCMTQAASGRGMPKSTIEACQESIEWADEQANVRVVNQLTKDDISDGFAKGLMKAEAMSAPSRQKAVRDIQEDILLEKGFAPVEVARLHNPKTDDADIMNDVKVRKESQRISNKSNRKNKNS